MKDKSSQFNVMNDIINNFVNDKSSQFSVMNDNML